MDDRRFDSLVKAVASGASRRSVLKGILGLGGAALAGGTLLEGDADAARRPTPTPKPVKCPGNQIPVGGVCTCPDAAPNKCGPACCTGEHGDPPAPGHTECCDNACCHGTCYGEELCCPTNQQQSGELILPPIASVCEDSECCYLPNVCTQGVCGPPPPQCQNNEECGPCEICNLQTGQCSSLCRSGQQCCVNVGQYCIAANETCCSSNSDCTEPCSSCNEISRMCVDHCRGSEVCCEGGEAGDECCGADQCIAGQGCCPAFYVACGGSCCNTEVYFCNERDQCECLEGTEACSELPGGCCPTGQCNAAFQCCAAGTIPCGVDCCDGLTQSCNNNTSTCDCFAGLIPCEGTCIDAECCGTDNSLCADLGLDLECVQCLTGECLNAGFDFNECDNSSGYCFNGICLPCLPNLSDCSHDSQCCSGACLNLKCDVH